MFETYRMLGSAHQAELERMAVSPHASEVRDREPKRLFSRSWRLRSNRAAVAVETACQIQGIPASNTGDAPVSATPAAP